MTEPTAFNLTDAALSDGTVDFYTLIGKTPEADSEDIRLRIQALYSEATANRDNRNLKKRREYQTLLELLPPARAALLEAPKRARYDDFLSKAKSGTAPTDFETFINDLMGFNDQLEEKTGLLGTKPTEKVEPRVTVLEVPVAKPTTSSRPTAPNSTSTSRPTTPSRPTSPPASGGGNAYSTGKSKKSSSGGPGGAIGAVGGLVLGFVVGYALFHNVSIIPAFLLAIILAAVGFVLFNGKVGNKISS